VLAWSGDRPKLALSGLKHRPIFFPPQAARLAAPDVALPATGSSLIASLVVWREVVG